MLFDESGLPIHRVALLEQTQVTAIITQSDVVKVLVMGADFRGFHLRETTEKSTISIL